MLVLSVHCLLLLQLYVCVFYVWSYPCDKVRSVISSFCSLHAEEEIVGCFTLFVQ